MKVLVTGATGFLGARLVHRLLSGGVRVRVLVRSQTKARPLADQGAEVVLGEITEKGAVLAALDGVVVVYHLAGKLLTLASRPRNIARRMSMEHS